MGLVPVNPLQVTSAVGHGPDPEDDFVVTRLSLHDRETSGNQHVKDRRGNHDDVKRTSDEQRRKDLRSKHTDRDEVQGNRSVNECRGDLYAHDERRDDRGGRSEDISGDHRVAKMS